MELTYTTEKSEKETVKLFSRLYGTQEVLRLGIAVVVMYWLFAICHLAVSTGSFAGVFAGACDIAFLLVVGIVSCLLCLAFVHVVAMRIRRDYRRRETHLIEYRLTDDTCSFVVGERAFSSPWGTMAKGYRLEEDVLFLFGGRQPFEARCIPDWKGHGVERGELVATLERAGVKKFMDWPRIVSRIGMVFFLVVGACTCIVSLSR